ncbi:tumor necrosis factor receptor superfamily member 13C isoform X1 [Erinaceus europaeus]|uniref:Tumor necrosis factor receptor superfamily member 13C isoform X1 n=1 Tax=Erinaceus europaeus TaxID=9365 RepID=A0ABM3X887_ERIEU|nr:tumor necrosis factor receptor superfamily member 13C isoform X1 [Erinaceus europaeus]
MGGGLGAPRRLSEWSGRTGSMRRRGRRSRDGQAPSPCLEALCFDLLVRDCVACSFLHTSEPRPALPPAGPPPPSPGFPCARCPSSLSLLSAAGTSSLEPGTALQPQESVGSGVAPAEGALPLPALLVGAPAGLGLALALLLLGLLSWRRRCGRGEARPEVAAAEPQEEPLDHVIILPPEPLLATAPVWPPPRDDPGATPTAHSVPVPATELGSTELVTTKTAGPEQQ